jgi:hypothetical protein
MTFIYLIGLCFFYLLLCSPTSCPILVGVRIADRWRRRQGGNTKLVQEIKESNKSFSCSGANLVCDQNSKAMMTLAGKAA